MLFLGGVIAGLVVAVPLAWASHQFTDVPDGHQFHAEIGAIADAGITSGKTCDPPGTPPTYCPNEPVVRQSMAAFMHRGFGRVAQSDTVEVPIGDMIVDLATITVSVGGVPGNVQFVKLDAAITAYISSTIGCPCGTAFWISVDGTGRISPFHFLLNDDISAFPGLTMQRRGYESGAATTVVAVETGSTYTFRVQAVREEAQPTSGAVTGYASLNAITAPFGSTGGSALGGESKPLGSR